MRVHRSIEDHSNYSSVLRTWRTHVNVSSVSVRGCQNQPSKISRQSCKVGRFTFQAKHRRHSGEKERKERKTTVFKLKDQNKSLCDTAERTWLGTNRITLAVWWLTTRGLEHFGTRWEERIRKGGKDDLCRHRKERAERFIQIFTEIPNEIQCSMTLLYFAVLNSSLLIFAHLCCLKTMSVHARA